MLWLMLGITPSAFAGGAGGSGTTPTPGPYDGQNPHTTTVIGGTTPCDTGAVDVPGSVREISINNVFYGELVIRESTVCMPARWAEVRFPVSKGYLVSVETQRNYPGAHDEYATKDEQSPIFDDMYSSKDTCSIYTASVTDLSGSDASAQISEELCELPPISTSEPIPTLTPSGVVVNPGLGGPSGSYSEPYPPGYLTQGPIELPSGATQQPKKVTTTKKKVTKPVCKKTKKVKKCKPAKKVKKVKKKTKSSKGHPEEHPYFSGGGA
jgi:hypothetical protein